MVKLDSICRPKQWKTIAASQLLDDGYIVYGANGKIGYYSEYTHEYPTVMITCRGATCGNVHISEPKAYINGNAMALDEVDPERVDIKYLRYCLIDRGFRDVISGSAQPQITGQGLSKVQIPLPPLETQKQIAAVLEQADQLRKDCKLLEQELNSLAQSVFIDMFGDPVTNPKGWEQAILERYLETGPTNGLYKHASLYGSGTPIIRIDGFYHGKLNGVSTFKRVQVTDSEKNKFNVRNRGVLINRVNSPQYLGKAAFVSGICEDTVYESNMMFLTVDESRLNSRFLVSLLGDSLIKNQIKTCSKDAVNQSSINQKDVKSFSIIVPDIELQNKYERFLTKLDEELENLVEYSNELDQQFNSLMQKAFKGELNL